MNEPIEDRVKNVEKEIYDQHYPKDYKGQRVGLIASGVEVKCLETGAIVKVHHKRSQLKNLRLALEIIEYIRA